MDADTYRSSCSYAQWDPDSDQNSVADFTDSLPTLSTEMVTQQASDSILGRGRPAGPYLGPHDGPEASSQSTLVEMGAERGRHHPNTSYEQPISREYSQYSIFQASGSLQQSPYRISTSASLGPSQPNTMLPRAPSQHTSPQYASTVDLARISPAQSGQTFMCRSDHQPPPGLWPLVEPPSSYAAITSPQESVLPPTLDGPSLPGSHPTVPISVHSDSDAGEVDEEQEDGQSGPAAIEISGADVEEKLKGWLEESDPQSDSKDQCPRCSRTIDNSMLGSRSKIIYNRKLHARSKRCRDHWKDRREELATGSKSIRRARKKPVATNKPRSATRARRQLDDKEQPGSRSRKKKVDKAAPEPHP